MNGTASSLSQIQANWNESDSSSAAYIQNKPTIPNEVTEQTVSEWGFTKNTGTSTFSGSYNDLTDKPTIPDISSCLEGPTLDANEHDYVDLGLPSGTLWSVKNLGASDNLSIGTYYKNPIYNTDRMLTWGEDFANIELGGHWRIPTSYHVAELSKNTDKTYYDNYNNLGFACTKYANKSDPSKYILIRAIPRIESSNVSGGYMLRASGNLSSLQASDGSIHSTVGFEHDSHNIRPILSPDDIKKSSSVSVTGNFNDLIDKPNMASYVKIPKIDENPQNYVSLALPSGTLWATKNIAAQNEYDAGWKYPIYEALDIAQGYYNPAREYYGGAWAVPTKQQIQELYQYTTVQKVTNYENSGVDGILFTHRYHDDIQMFVPIISNPYSQGDDFCYSFIDDVLTGHKSWEVDDTYKEGSSLVSSMDGGTTGKISLLIRPVLSYSANVDINRASISSISGQYKDLKDIPMIPTVTCGDHEYVDLNLPSGTLWAKMNIGANSESRLGTTGANSIQFNEQLSKSWGGSWHMPTNLQFYELINNTTQQYVTINGIEGCKFIGNNNNWIFLPYTEFIPYTESYDEFVIGAYASCSVEDSKGIKVLYYSTRDNSIGDICVDSTSKNSYSTLGMRLVLDRTPINIPQIWRGTQVQYDSLSSYDNNTIYIITAS